MDPLSSVGEKQSPLESAFVSSLVPRSFAYFSAALRKMTRRSVVQAPVAMAARNPANVKKFDREIVLNMLKLFTDCLLQRLGIIGIQGQRANFKNI